MSESRRHGLETALDAAQTENGEMTLCIANDLSHINLRGNLSDSAFLDAVIEVLQQALPLAANTVTTGEHRIYWLGPDEWQVVTSVKRGDELVARCRGALQGIHASVHDLSGGMVTFRLQGEGARDLLAKATTLDLSPMSFVPGSCAQTGLAKASMLIACVEDADFEITVRRSFADYVLRWLQHAAGTSGMSVR